MQGRKTREVGSRTQEEDLIPKGYTLSKGLMKANDLILTSQHRVSTPYNFSAQLRKCFQNILLFAILFGKVKKLKRTS